MRKFLILATGIAAFTSFAPASYAQGIGIACVRQTHLRLGER